MKNIVSLSLLFLISFSSCLLNTNYKFISIYDNKKLEPKIEDYISNIDYEKKFIEGFLKDLGNGVFKDKMLLSDTFLFHFLYKVENGGHFTVFSEKDTYKFHYSEFTYNKSKESGYEPNVEKIKDNNVRFHPNFINDIKSKSFEKILYKLKKFKSEFNHPTLLDFDSFFLVKKTENKKNVDVILIEYSELFLEVKGSALSYNNY